MGYELHPGGRTNPNQAFLTMAESLSSIRLQEDNNDSSHYEESAPATPEPQQQPAVTETLRGRVVVYDNRHLSRNLWERASRGIASDSFSIEKCAAIQQRGYYAFRIADPGSSSGGCTVRIGHSKDAYGQPACSCEEFDENLKTACGHIFWLMDRIIDYSGETDMTAADAESLPLQPTGSALLTTTAFDQIDRVGLAELAESKGFEFSQSGSDHHAPGWVEQEYALGSKEADVLDMLAYYARNDSPYLDREGILGSSNSLAAAVYRMSVANPHVFRALRAETSEEMCAVAYMKKMREQVRKTFARWRTFVERGIPSGPEARPDDDGNDDAGGEGQSSGADIGAPTATWCAASLRNHVKRIGEAVDKRRGMGAEGKREAMELLVHILSEVVHYHLEPPQRNSEEEPAPTTQTLFEILVKDVPFNEPHFVLPTMQKLVSVGGSFTQELDNLRSDVRSAVAGGGFLQALGNFVEEVTAYHERPVSPPNTQRRKRSPDDILESPTKRRFNSDFAL